MRYLVILLLLAGQDPPAASTQNPLPELKEQVKVALAEAGLPFTDEQDKAIVLMMEDRRRSAEDLFGQTMDFTAGPTQGQQVGFEFCGPEYWRSPEVMESILRR